MRNIESQLKIPIFFYLMSFLKTVTGSGGSASLVRNELVHTDIR